MRTVNYNGNMYDFDLLVSYMDDDIREAVYNDAMREDYGEQQFFDKYLERDGDFVKLFDYDIDPIRPED